MADKPAAGQTRAGQAEAARAKRGLPQSMVELRGSIIEQVRAFRRWEAACWTQQKARRAADDDLYLAAWPGQPVLTFAEFRAEIKASEKALKDDTPQGVWRSAMRQLKAEGERIEEE